MLFTVLSEQCVVSGVHGAMANGADDGVMTSLMAVVGREDLCLSLLSLGLPNLTHQNPLCLISL